MQEIQNLRNKLEQQKGKRDQIQDLLTKEQNAITQLDRDLHRHERGREIIREVGLKTQRQLQYHISDIASLALGAVFEDPYELLVDFVERRNKTECDLHFVKNGNRMTPKDASGGGVVDVAAFALRVASWSMLKQTDPNINNTIILDEPFRMVDVNRQERAAPMVKEVSDKLGIQFIIVTHEPVIGMYADELFETKIKDGITQIQ